MGPDVVYPGVRRYVPILCLLLGLNIGLAFSLVSASGEPAPPSRESILLQMRQRRLLVQLEQLAEELRRIEAILGEHNDQCHAEVSDGGDRVPR